MFSRIGRQYSNLAFRGDNAEFRRNAALRYAESVLTDYLAGRERAYSVRDALHELHAAFGVGALLAADLIEKALARDPDDEEARLQLVTKALDLIGRQQRGDRVGED